MLTVLASAVAMRLRRIDLYPVGTMSRTTITIHVSRSVKARLATKLLLGFDEPSIFPVANRLTAEAASSIPVVSSSALQRGALRNDAMLDEPPERDR